MIQAWSRLVLAGFLLLTCNAIITSKAWASENYGLLEQITVRGETLTLKEAVDHKGQGFIAEYIHDHKNWDNWTLMFAVRLVPRKDLDPVLSARATANSIIAQKQVDPVANAAVFEKDGNAVVDFLVSGPNFSMLEHNMWRYSQTEKGLLIYQIARRMYVNDNTRDRTEGFIKEIVVIRNDIIRELESSELPVPQLQ